MAQVLLEREVSDLPAGKPALVYHEDYQKYDFGSGHALREVRGKLARDLIESLGLLRAAEEKRPSSAGEDAILSVHERKYVTVVKRLSANPKVGEPDFGLEPGDNPPFAGMYEAAALQVGGTLLACDLVARGQATRAYNLGGGFHHAMPARASGFCVFNDVAIGVRHLLERRIRRILYVDIDAHHGDGVQAAFYRDPRVLTISLHEDPRFLFPGTGTVDEIGEGDGKGYAVNVPLPPHTRDEGWTRAFDAIVLPLAEAYRPEVLVTQTGADAHTDDPLAHLDLTTESYEHAGARFDTLARTLCRDRWVATCGGGYDVTAVPRVWTLLFAAMVRRRPTDTLPERWREECRRLVRAEPRDGTLRDPPVPPEGGRISRELERTIEQVRARVFPFHGLDPGTPHF